MSALGQKQTLRCPIAMSALTPKAVTLCAERDVRFVPIADIQACRERKKKSAPTQT